MFSFVQLSADTVVDVGGRRFLHAGVAMACLVALLGSVPATVSPAAASADVARKVHAPVGIALDAARFADGSTRIVVENPTDLKFLRVQVLVGNKKIVNRRFEDLAAGRFEFDVGELEAVGIDSVRVKAHGVGDDGPVFASDRIWFDATQRADTVIVSEIGTEDLQFKVEQFQIDNGIAVSGARTSSATDHDPPMPSVVSGAAAQCGSVEICVDGSAHWSDAFGNAHPIRAAFVDLVEVGPAHTERVLATTSTDDFGGYELAVPASSSTDVFVRLRAAGEGFRIVVDRGGLLEARSIDSTTVSTVRPGDTVVVSFALDNSHPAETAFSLHAAMTYALEAFPRVGSTAPPNVDIVYPSSGTFYSPGTQRIHMLEADRWDWDVMLHEYGHYVARHLGIDDSSGGPHSIHENIGDRLNKDTANALAWSEGWATYYAVSTLHESGAAALGIPGIGDTRYQDFEDTYISIDLELDARRGEDNEVTVSAWLWDLFDTPSDGLDNVALGRRGVWEPLAAGHPTTLSDAYALFAPDRGSRSDGINCVASQMNVAPQLVGAPRQPIPAAAPSLTWVPGNGGDTGTNNSFVVEYRNADSTVVLHRQVTTAAAAQATQTEWDRIVAHASGTVNVTVLGSATERAPATGPYRSCVQQFTGGPAAPVAPLITATVPTRYVDTRPGEATFDGAFAGGGRRGAGAISRVQVAGRGVVPADARAAVVNLTVAQASANGYVTAFDCQLPLPVASSINHVAGVSVANEIVVSLDTSGELCLFTAAETHVIVDVVGYVEVMSPLVTVTPARVLESRSVSQGTTDGHRAGVGRLEGGTEMMVSITGRAGVAADAAAVIINIAAVAPDRAGFVTVHPCLTPRPTASSLNVSAGVTRADEIVAPLDAGGNVCVYTSGTTDVIMDVVGYVPATGGYTAVDPARFADTRPGHHTVDGQAQGVGMRAGGETMRVRITGRHGVPVSATAVIAYVTAVGPTGPGYVTVWPCDQGRPHASSMNYTAGVTGGNELVALLSATGEMCLYTSGDTHLTIDVAGYISG